MKIGLMGGTFDPPHNAHINMAECAMKEYNLDKIMFMTGGNPPHKRTNTPSLLRHHMIKLAIADNSNFFASSYEIEKTGILPIRLGFCVRNIRRMNFIL